MYACASLNHMLVPMDTNYAVVLTTIETQEKQTIIMFNFLNYFTGEYVVRLHAIALSWSFAHKELSMMYCDTRTKTFYHHKWSRGVDRLPRVCSFYTHIGSSIGTSNHQSMFLFTCKHLIPLSLKYLWCMLKC